MLLGLGGEQKLVLALQDKQPPCTTTDSKQERFPSPPPPSPRVPGGKSSWLQRDAEQLISRAFFGLFLGLAARFLLLCLFS